MGYIAIIEKLKVKNTFFFMAKQGLKEIGFKRPNLVLDAHF